MESNEIEQLWSSYLEHERRGVPSAALADLRLFTDKLGADPFLRDEWARTILRRREQGDDAYPIRTPLFEKVIFPFLAEQYSAGDPDAATWLARLNQLLFRARACWEALGRLGTVQECSELQDDVAELQALLRGAEAEQFAALIWEAEFHYRAYREYLTDKGGHLSYESFFKSRGPA